jgi:hypothetical protein
VVEPDPLRLALRRQGEQKLARLRPDHVLGPLRRERRAAREVLERERVDDREIVVAGEDDRAVRLGQRDARIGVGAVADEVAEAPQLLDLRVLRGGDHGLEGVLVPMYVRRDRDAHA